MSGWVGGVGGWVGGCGVWVGEGWDTVLFGMVG